MCCSLSGKWVEFRMVVSEAGYTHPMKYKMIWHEERSIITAFLKSKIIRTSALLTFCIWNDAGVYIWSLCQSLVSHLRHKLSRGNNGHPQNGGADSGPCIHSFEFKATRQIADHVSLVKWICGCYYLVLTKPTPAKWMSSFKLTYREMDGSI